MTLLIELPDTVVHAIEAAIAATRQSVAMDGRNVVQPRWPNVEAFLAEMLEQQLSGLVAQYPVPEVAQKLAELRAIEQTLKAKAHIRVRRAATPLQDKQV